jgi:SAM-dependent methyltransferase
MLHFAPEPILYPLLEATDCDYKTTDFFLKDVDFPGEDIQALNFENGVFDCVLSNHVIEQFENDGAVLREVERILTPGGIAVIPIPGDWKRHETVTFPDLSNNGHDRDYGLDVIGRLKEVFSKVEAIDLFDEGGSEATTLGVDPKHDLAFVCRK